MTAQPTVTTRFVPEVPIAPPVPHPIDPALLLPAPTGVPLPEQTPPVPVSPPPPAQVYVPQESFDDVPHRHLRPHHRRGVGPRGRRRTRGDIALTVGSVGLGITAGIGVMAVKDGLGLPGGLALAGGTMAALIGTYLCLVLMLMVARIPWIEREVGQDRLVALHRTVAPYSLFLILGHVLLTTVSYSQAETHGVVAQFVSLVLHSAWMMPALAAFLIMMSLGVISYRRIRERMSYETWWVAHLYFYIAVLLSFGHQIALGPMFVAHPYQRYYWTALYVLAFGAIIVARFVRPISFSVKHQLRVAAVVPEAHGVISVYLSGHDLDLVQARGGQFFQWRFLTRDYWWQAHPYSLSAAPNSSWLRITVKDLGDHSADLRRMRVGTRVLAEGPYGVFHAGARHGEQVTAFAAGVGITPIRAILDDFPDDTDVTLVYRVPDRDGAPLRHELEELVISRGWRLHYLQGSRHQHPLTARYLTELVPGFADSDVYVCGPAAFTDQIVSAATAAGVPDRQIHHEQFAF